MERVAIYRSIANFYANFRDRQFSYYQKILSTFPGNVAWHRAQSRSIYEAVQIVSENEKKIESGRRESRVSNKKENKRDIKKDWN